MLEACEVCGELHTTRWRGWYHQEFPKLCGGPCAVVFFKARRDRRTLAFEADPRFEPFVQAPDRGFRAGSESRFATWCDDHGIAFLYEPYIFRLSNGEGYLPDFLLRRSQTFIEVKGLWDARGKRKYRRCRKEFPALRLFVADELFLTTIGAKRPRRDGGRIVRR